MTFRYLFPAIALLFALVGCQSSESPSEPETASPETASTEKITTIDLLPRTALFGNPEKTRGRISPDGSQVSWLAAVEGVLNVWVAPASDPASAKPVTHDTGRGIREYFWAPDSSAILYLQDKGGNENNHIFRVALDSGEIADLTPMDDQYKAQIYGISHQRPEVIAVGLNTRDPELYDLYEIELASGKQTLVMENPGYGSWIVDNDLRPRLAVNPLPDGSQEIVSVSGEDKGKAVLTIPAEDTLDTNPLGFDGDNRHLYLVDTRGRDKAALVKLDTIGGDSTVLSGEHKANVEDVFFHPLTSEPIAYSVNYLENSWHGLSETAREQVAKLTGSVSGSLSLLGSTEDAGQWIVYADDPQAPGTYYLFDSSTGNTTKLFDTRPELAELPLQPSQALVIKARDGLDLVSYLTLPAGSDPDGDGIPTAPLPMALTVHGGPWARDSYGYDAWHQWLANRGYAVLSVNYRGSSGFGKAFTNAAVREFAGAMHDDLLDAVAWTVAQGIADAKRVAIMGGSYGGYATLIGVSHTPDTFACGVDIVGPSNLATLIETFPDYWKPWLASTWYKFVGDPANPEERADMVARSAISKVDQIKVPLLIGQGENDPRVVKAESDQMVAAMEENGLPVTYVNYPDEGHGFARPENRLSFYAITEAFLADCLGGSAEPVGDAFNNSSIEVLGGITLIDGLEEALAQAGKAGPAAGE